MELLLKRTTRTEESTVGELYVDNVFQCYILEDLDRGLKQEMPLSTIQKIKVDGKTAIPAGRYEIAITFSNHFQKYMPLLMNVPGYAGVRIHSGNESSQTEGCLLCGTTKGVNVVRNSRAAFTALFSKLKAVEKKEKIFITIS